MKLGNWTTACLIWLVAVSVTSCSTTQPKIDLCDAGIKVFKMRPSEIDALQDRNFDNAVHTNCVLHKYCGLTISSPEICEE